MGYLRHLGRALGPIVDRQAAWVAAWLYSRSAFVWLVYGSVAWVPLVVGGFDKHGFLYLYIATSLSLITQAPLAMLARRAALDAAAAEQKGQATMEAMLAALEALETVLISVREDLDEQAEDLDEVLDLSRTAEHLAAAPKKDTGA